MTAGSAMLAMARRRPLPRAGINVSARRARADLCRIGTEPGILPIPLAQSAALQNAADAFDDVLNNLVHVARAGLENQPEHGRIGAIGKIRAGAVFTSPPTAPSRPQ